MLQRWYQSRRVLVANESARPLKKETIMTFQCSYADKGQTRCPEWRCDCFIVTHPDSPFDLHPEDFVVMALSQVLCIHEMPIDWCATCNGKDTDPEKEEQELFTGNLLKLGDEDA
jgi:hypothetical protein